MRIAIMVILGVASASVMRGSVLVGGPPNANNCVPFSCPALFGVTQYEQLYAAGDFPGRMTITALTFFNTQFPEGSLSAGIFTLSLSTVGDPVGAFTRMVTLGPDATVIFSGTLGSVPFGGSVTLGGDTNFEYDPANGSLLLSVQITGGSLGGVALDSRNDAVGIFSRASDGVASGNIGFGLVTQFETAPEPSGISLGLFGMGALALLALRRRRSLRSGAYHG